MKRMWIALALLVGCSNEAATDNRARPADQPQKRARTGKPAELGQLVGLYEGSGSPAHQMCVVKRASGHGFGLVVWGGNNHSCSGSGAISRDGDRVKLVMAGDSPCTLTGAISAETIRLSEEQPAGCSYYCGARARLEGAELTQIGDTEADALKARDLVGEPLCSGM